MTPANKLDVRALAGSLLFASLALSTGLVDRRAGTPAATGTGSVVGVVEGAHRYRVLLTPVRGTGASSTDRWIDGWGRRFRGDGLPPGRYRLSLIVDPDGSEPWLVVPLPLPADATPVPVGSADYSRVEQFASEFARVSSSGRAGEIGPFFDDQFRGPSGQTRTEHIDQARASQEEAETVRFAVAVRSVYRAADRWFAELAYQGAYRVRRTGDVRRAAGLFLSELSDDGAALRFRSTEAIPLPSLGGIEALERRIVPAPDLGLVVVRGGATTVLPRPIVVSVPDRVSPAPPR